MWVSIKSISFFENKQTNATHDTDDGFLEHTLSPVFSERLRFSNVLCKLGIYSKKLKEIGFGSGGCVGWKTMVAVLFS